MTKFLLNLKSERLWGPGAPKVARAPVHRTPCTPYMAATDEENQKNARIDRKIRV